MTWSCLYEGSWMAKFGGNEFINRVPKDEPVFEVLRNEPQHV